MKKKTKQVPVPAKEKNKFKDKFFAYLLAGCMIFWTIASVLGIVGFANTIEKEKAVESSTAVAVSADNIHQVRQNKGASNRQVKDKQKSFDLATSTFTFDLPFFDNLYFTDDGDSQYSVFTSRATFTSYGRYRTLTIDGNSWALMQGAPDEGTAPIYKASYLKAEEILITDLQVYPLIMPAYFIESEQYYPYSFTISFYGYDIGLGGVCLRFDVVERAYIGGLPDVSWSFLMDTGVIETGDGIFLSGLGYQELPDVSLRPVQQVVGITYGEYFNQNAGGSYDRGYEAGKQDGVQQGYESGYNAGDSIGYNRGYSEGIENANQYTFRRLITAVIDTPVQVFTDLFNFEILGVNLTGFFLGLFSIALCLGVIKLIF